MKVLALETTERVGSVAAAEDVEVVAQTRLDPSLRSAQALAPAVVRLLAELGWRPADVELVAVSIGPGSFTGLRLGVTMAKTFAYAVGAEVLGIDTLQTIAAGVPANVHRVAVAVDAQRGQVAAALLARDNGGRFRPEGPTRLIDAEAWLSGVPDGVSLAGPVLEKLGSRLPAGRSVVAPEFWRPTAAHVARLGALDYAAGRRDDLWRLTPHYSRRAAAEERKP